MEVARELVAKQSANLSPEKLEETQRLLKEMGQQLSGTVVPVQFNALADRINVLFKKKRLSDADVEELKHAELNVDRLIDQALDMQEPHRSRSIKVMSDSKMQIKALLDELERD